MAQQVYLQRGVNRVQVVVAAGQVGVVGEVDRVNFKRGIAVHVAVKLGRTQRKCGNTFARQIIFTPVRHGTAFNQRHDAVAYHFGMNAQVMLGCQLHHYRVGYAAVSNLQRGTVVNHVGYIFADGNLHRTYFGQAHLQQGLATFNQCRDLGYVHVTIAKGKRYVGVDFYHHRARLGHSCQRVVGPQAE